MAGSVSGRILRRLSFCRSHGNPYPGPLPKGEGINQADRPHSSRLSLTGRASAEESDPLSRRERAGVRASAIDSPGTNVGTRSPIRCRKQIRPPLPPGEGRGEGECDRQPGHKLRTRSPIRCRKQIRPPLPPGEGRGEGECDRQPGHKRAPDPRFGAGNRSDPLSHRERAGVRGLPRAARTRIVAIPSL